MPIIYCDFNSFGSLISARTAISDRQKGPKISAYKKERTFRITALPCVIDCTGNEGIRNAWAFIHMLGWGGGEDALFRVTPRAFYVSVSPH